MSTFGVRLQLLRSQTASQLLRQLKEAPHRIKMSLTKGSSHNISAGDTSVGNSEDANPSKILQLRMEIERFARAVLSSFPTTAGLLGPRPELSNQDTNIQINLDGMAFMKHQNLAWSGVLWRADIAGVLAGFNLLFWFYSLPGAAADECVYTVFMFSKQLLQGRLLDFFKAGGIIVAVGIFPQAVALAILFLRLSVFLIMCIYRDILFNVLLRGEPEAREQIQANLRRMNSITERLGRSGLRMSLFMPGSSVSLLRIISPFRSLADTLQFLSSSDVEDIRFSDILKLCASLASQHVSVQTNRSVEMAVPGSAATANNSGSPGSPSLAKEPDFWGKWISRCWNILMFLTIVWFILSIELTIAWNDIQGVNTIQTTGQLIPFIIGVTSAAQAVQNVFVSTVKKAYPDWSNLQLVVKQDLEGFTEFRIVKQELNVSTQEAEV
ncbi:hypothetical protein ABW20_dc0106570 [Dactylellina cionopaga]|nr:hypothetical protein ABW20_dc0106570 [Dactylellina cionopaga]